MSRFRVRPEYFPTTTQSAIPLEDITRWEILPLGVKEKRKRLLNVGALDPRKPGIYKEVARLAREASYDGFQLFRISREDFESALSQIYRSPLKAE